MRPTTTLVGLLSVASAAMTMPTLPKEPVAALVAESDTNELANLGLFGDVDDLFELPFKIGRSLLKPLTGKKERLEAEGADGNDSTQPGTENEPATEGEPATEDGAKDDAAMEALVSVFKGLSEQIEKDKNY